MTTTLCGHEREALIWALTDPDPLNNAERERKVIFAVGGVPDFAALTPTHKQRFAAIIRDPAKLAELMAEAMRQLVAPGLTIGVQGVTDLLGQGILLALVSPRRPVLRLLMPQARVALLRLMQLPEGTPVADVLNALEVGT